jgi:putative ABC transport system permease protein
MNLGVKQVFKNKLASIPQIDMISIGGAAPSSGNTNSTEITYKDGRKEVKTDVQQKYADENYIQFIRSGC